jgi:hypothetical protein
MKGGGGAHICHPPLPSRTRHLLQPRYMNPPTICVTHPFGISIPPSIKIVSSPEEHLSIWVPIFFRQLAIPNPYAGLSVILPSPWLTTSYLGRTQLLLLLLLLLFHLLFGW